MSEPTPTSGIYFWPVRLVPGVRRTHLLTLYYAAFVTIGFVSLLNFLQPYLLIENLRVAPGRQGTLTGQLGFVSEAMLICLGVLVGSWSDRIGRNPVFALGLLLLGLGYVGIAHVDSVPQMFAVRVLWAVGACLAGVMLTSTQTDYPQDADRGKLLGLAAFITALGVTVFILVGGQLPAIFRARGLGPVEAGRLAMYVVAAMALVSACGVRLGLKRGPPAEVHASRPFVSTLRDGLHSARNPRLALCYVAAFVARSDMTVVGLYFSLWITTTGVENGLNSADALARATLLFSAMNVASLLWAPIMGAIIDRLDRLTALGVAVTLAAAGYGSMCLVSDPIDNPGFWPWLILLGMGVISPVLAAQALLGQEADTRQRGTVNGMFTATGAIGNLCLALAGGYLFDAWKLYPFLVVAVLNVVLLGGVLWLRVSR